MTRTEIIKKHIEEYYPIAEELARDVRAAGGINNFIEGGCLAVYYDDVKGFMAQLGKEVQLSIDDDSSWWTLYKKTVTPIIEKIIATA